MQRTHRVSLHPPATPAAPGARDRWGRPATAPFQAASAPGIPCNLQPLTGSVRQAAAGREVDATWQGFFPPGTTITADMGLVVTEVFDGGEWKPPPAGHPKTFRVRPVGWQGGRWDVEAMLGHTDEAVAP